MATTYPDRLRYDRVAASLHWLTAALVIPLVLIGLFGEALGEAYGPGPIFFHKSLGMTVFAVTIARLAWRVFHRPPPLPATTPAWQKGAAHGAHFLIYALMIALPISGYMFSSAGPYPLLWFGNEVPKLAVSEATGEAAHGFHEVAGIFMAALLAVHIGAALYHQFVQKDRLVARMNPFAPS